MYAEQEEGELHHIILLLVKNRLTFWVGKVKHMAIIFDHVHLEQQIFMSGKVVSSPLMQQGYASLYLLNSLYTVDSQLLE